MPSASCADHKYALANCGQVTKMLVSYTAEAGLHEIFSCRQPSRVPASAVLYSQSVDHGKPLTVVLHLLHFAWSRTHDNLMSQLLPPESRHPDLVQLSRLLLMLNAFDAGALRF